ncbi:MAG: chloride channel protein, partial [Phycisphaeraceae bacterium]
MTRSLALAAVVGLAAGVGAVAFHMLTEAVVHVALRQVVGYDQGGPPGEVRLLEHVTAVFRPWMLLVVPTIGGLISGYLVYRFAPEAEGHGTDAAIDAYHNKRGHIPPAVPIVKMFASAITIGTGGSGGREGPIAQIGAGFGSYLSARLGLSDPERRVLLAAGLGAGIGAIFQAPLAGAIFAVEVLYRDPDFESEALISAFIATVVAYCTFNVVMAVLTSVVGMPFEGFVQLFDVAAGIRCRDPLLLLPLTGLVVVMVAASWLYVHTFYRVQAIFKRLAIRSWIKPGLGAMGAGSIAL